MDYNWFEVCWRISLLLILLSIYMRVSTLHYKVNGIIGLWSMSHVLSENSSKVTGELLEKLGEVFHEDENETDK